MHPTEVCHPTKEGSSLLTPKLRLNRVDPSFVGMTKHHGKKMKTNLYIITLGGLLAFNACKPAGTADEPAVPTEKSSFTLMQERVLTPSCATVGCHASDKDPSFAQHGLVLSAEGAFANLINVLPKNRLALADGLMRVKPFISAQSLLFHKLNVDAAHHGGKQYGNPMPLGMTPLTVGQIEFVRRWIDAGAPREGNVVDATLLDDKTPSVKAAPFELLPKPAAGQGYQLNMPEFSVAPNFERELFVRRELGNPTDIYVNRVQIKMRPNSHHFIAYGFRSNNALPVLDVIRDLRNPDGSANLLTFLSMQNHIFMAGTQTPSHDYTFPDGAALLMPANMSLDLNPHYVNKTNVPLPGEISMNLYTVDKSKVVNVVRSLNEANTSFSLPAGKVTVIITNFTYAKPRTILAITSHTHKLAQKFVVKIKGGARNGEVIYTNTDWESPEIVNFKTPLLLKAGEGLTSEVTYNNTTAKTVNFGLMSEDEMNIIFGYFYE